MNRDSGLKKKFRDPRFDIGIENFFWKIKRTGIASRVKRFTILQKTVRNLRGIISGFRIKKFFRDPRIGIGSVKTSGSPRSLIFWLTNDEDDLMLRYTEPERLKICFHASKSPLANIMIAIHRKVFLLLFRSLQHTESEVFSSEFHVNMFFFSWIEWGTEWGILCPYCLWSEDCHCWTSIEYLCCVWRGSWRDSGKDIQWSLPIATIVHYWSSTHGHYHSSGVVTDHLVFVYRYCSWPFGLGLRYCNWPFGLCMYVCIRLAGKFCRFLLHPSLTSALSLSRFTSSLFYSCA